MRSEVQAVMRRFAELDESNVVVRVIVAESSEWCEENLGGQWVETFTDGTRGNRASSGYFYDSERDLFLTPKRFDSWVLDEETAQWVAPIAYPDDGADYQWDESAVAWVEVVEPSA